MWIILTKILTNRDIMYVMGCKDIFFMIFSLNFVAHELNIIFLGHAPNI